jgi:uncharacterized membrane protein (UPF0182 family)
MEFAKDSLAYRKRYTTMTDQPKDDFPVIRKMGRAITGLLYLEMGIYLILGLVALLIGGVSWLVDVFK